MTEKIKKLESTLNQHYWGANGVYQKEYDQLYESLVPSSGDAPTTHGEMIRAISRLYYDFCNNGNCNALDIEMETCDDCEGCGFQEGTEDEDGDMEDCYTCDGYCQVEGDVYVTDYYDEMLYFLETYMNEKHLAKELRYWMVNNYQSRYSFSDEQMNMYDRVVDAVVYQCLTTTNTPNKLFKVEA